MIYNPLAAVLWFFLNLYFMFMTELRNSFLSYYVFLVLFNFKNLDNHLEVVHV